MSLDNRHSNIGRRPTQTYVPPKSNRKYYEDESEDEKKINFKFWFILVLLLMFGYIYLDKVESYLLKNVYIELKNNIPEHKLNTINTNKDYNDIFKHYQRDNKLPYYEDEVNVILLVVDSYSGKNMVKSNKVKEIIDDSISKENKKIRQKYYVLEIDNTIVMDENLFKQEYPWKLLTKYKTSSILNYGKLPEIDSYVNIKDFVFKLKEKFPNSIISLNISNEIQDTPFAYNSLMDIGKLTKEGVIVTVSPGSFEETEALTERLKKFKYYTIQRMAFQLLEENVIDIKNFKIALNADKINASIRDNQELFNDYQKMKIRNGGLTNKRIDKEFIEKWINKYPEMFESDNAPMEYFIENKSLFKKEYESDSTFANPKVNLEKTKLELNKELKKE